MTALTSPSLLERDQIGPHPAAEGFDAKPQRGSLGDIFDGDDLVVDEWLEGSAKDLLVLPGPGESRREDCGAFPADGLGDMLQQRERGLVLLDLLVQQIKLW